MKKVVGVGIVENRGLRKNNKKATAVWQSMLERCYSDISLSIKPTYVKATVCDQWLHLDIFIKWFDRNYPRDGKKYQLDKDLRMKGNKLYSPETCIFIEQGLNKFMTNNKKTTSTGKSGVEFRNKKYIVRIQCLGKRKWCGSFDSFTDACDAYDKERLTFVASMKRLYSFDIPKNILDNLR